MRKLLVAALCVLAGCDPAASRLRPGSKAVVVAESREGAIAVEGPDLPTFRVGPGTLVRVIEDPGRSMGANVRVRVSEGPDAGRVGLILRSELRPVAE